MHSRKPIILKEMLTFSKEGEKMRNKLISKVALISTVAILTALISSTALAWGPATHTWLAKKLGNKYGPLNLQEMYGAVLPDVFNLMFGDPHQEYLWNETHYNFWKVVDEARCCRSRAFAYWFASHNELFGADCTAHLDSFTYPGDGYVIKKSKELAPMLLDYEVEGVKILKEFLDFYEFSDEEAYNLALRLANSNVEFAVDLRVRQDLDRLVGLQMLWAAKYRSLFVPFLLCKAYAQDYADEAGKTVLEACAIIATVEGEFKRYMEQYGAILTLPTKEQIEEAMVELGVELARTILFKEYEITDEPPREVMEYCLTRAGELVEGDCLPELQQTLIHVEEKLELNGIETCYWYWYW